jgi:hypothetical protein
MDESEPSHPYYTSTMSSPDDGEVSDTSVNEVETQPISGRRVGDDEEEIRLRRKLLAKRMTATIDSNKRNQSEIPTKTTTQVKSRIVYDVVDDDKKKSKKVDNITTRSVVVGEMRIDSKEHRRRGEGNFIIYLLQSNSDK